MVFLVLQFCLLRIWLGDGTSWRRPSYMSMLWSALLELAEDKGIYNVPHSHYQTVHTKWPRSSHSPLNILPFFFFFKSLWPFTLKYRPSKYCQVILVWSMVEGAFPQHSRHSWWNHTLAELPPLPWQTQLLLMTPLSFFYIHAHTIHNVEYYCMNKARISASHAISTPILLCVCFIS